ncbi:MAG: hypothetical protein M3Y56_14730, partial [Armatimonadota bacterium]|nr:hypothetical protein [Armatimonadota bacterium]
SQVEGLAAMTDVARRFLSEALEREPLSNSKTWGEAIQDMPDTMTSAAASATEDLAGIPGRMMDTFYAEYGGQRPQARRNPGRTGGTNDRATNPESEIVTRTRAYLRQFSAHSALVTSVVSNVSLATGYPQDVVRAAVLRHFVSSGPFVRDQSASNTSPREGQVLSNMAHVLTGLGYHDLRYDCPLKAFPDMGGTAALVAFAAAKPLILCYPTDGQGSQDPTIREEARFQAAAVDPDGGARFVWVSDGSQDYFFDAEGDLAIAALPRHQDSSPVV